QDMFDLKPEAPAGIRSEFRPVPTSAPGVSVCEHLPKTARWMHAAAIVRSVFHNGGCHHNPPPYTRDGAPPPPPSPRPTPGPPPPAVPPANPARRARGWVGLYPAREARGKSRGELSNYVSLPCPLGWGEARRKPGPGGGFLGQRFDPLYTECTAYVDRPMKK